MATFWEEQFCLWRSDATVEPTWFHAVPADVIDHLGLFCGPVKRHNNNRLGSGMQMINAGELDTVLRPENVLPEYSHLICRQLCDISTKWQWHELLFSNGVGGVLVDLFRVCTDKWDVLRLMSNLCKRASSARALAAMPQLCQEFACFVVYKTEPHQVADALACYQALRDNAPSADQAPFTEDFLQLIWTRMCAVAFIPDDGFSVVYIDPPDFVALLAFGRHHGLNIDMSTHNIRDQCDHVLWHALESRNVEQVSETLDAFEAAGLPCRGKDFMYRALEKYHRFGEVLERLAQMPPHPDDTFDIGGGELLARGAIASGRLKALLLYVRKDPDYMLPVVELELMRQFGSCQEMLLGGRHPDPDWQHLIQLLRDRHQRFGRWLGSA